MLVWTLCGTERTPTRPLELTSPQMLHYRCLPAAAVGYRVQSYSHAAVLTVRATALWSPLRIDPPPPYFRALTLLQDTRTFSPSDRPIWPMPAYSRAFCSHCREP